MNELDPKTEAKDAAGKVVSWLKEIDAASRHEREWRERRALMAQRTEQRGQFHQALLQQLEQCGAGAEYLQTRGISPETAIAWQLGVAGGRLTIPLNDASGQTVGFCGRAIGGQEPKYRNSTGDLLFQRNGLVFGLDQAAEAIRKQGTALLVEGPLDVIQLHQAGFTHAVACLGTSVSELPYLSDHRVFGQVVTPGAFHLAAVAAVAAASSQPSRASPWKK